MILFCDTPALLKLYIDEPESASLKRLVAVAEAVAVCSLAWSEIHTALSRRAREVPKDAVIIEQVKSALSRDWPSLVVMDVNQAVLERAGDYADTFALAGNDSVHLAAACEAGRVSQLPIFFASFESRLNKAAKLLEMRCLSLQ